jgi:hypothetical protein
MINIILDILAMDDFYGVSETIDIAKGKNEIPLTFKSGIKKVKRKWQQKR